jgi:hypothetical protein
MSEPMILSRSGWFIDAYGHEVRDPSSRYRRLYQGHGLAGYRIEYVEYVDHESLTRKARHVIAPTGEDWWEPWPQSRAEVCR